jgi:hypothetical protein
MSAVGADKRNSNADKKAKFTSAMVYHIGGNDIAAGIYRGIDGRHFTGIVPESG